MKSSSPETRLFSYHRDKKTVVMKRAGRTSPKTDDETICTQASIPAGERQQIHSFNKLIATSGPFAGKACIIDRKEIDVGRARICGIQLIDPAVSAFHARITTGEDECIITDLSSRNGTFVNGRRITEPYALKTGDRIEMGDVCMIFLAKGGVISADELRKAGKREETASVYKKYAAPLALAVVLLVFAAGGWFSRDGQTSGLQASIQSGVIQSSGIAPSLPEQKLIATAPPENKTGGDAEPPPAVQTEKAEAKTAWQEEHQQTEKEDSAKKRQTVAQQKPKKPENSSLEEQAALALNAYEKGAVSKAVRHLQKAAANTKSASWKKKLEQMANSMKKALTLYKKGEKEYKRSRFQNALKNWKQALVINRELIGDKKGYIGQNIGQKIADEYCRRGKKAYENGKPAQAEQYLEIALAAFAQHPESMKFKAVLSKK